MLHPQKIFFYFFLIDMDGGGWHTHTHTLSRFLRSSCGKSQGYHPTGKLEGFSQAWRSRGRSLINVTTQRTFNFDQWKHQIKTLSRTSAEPHVPNFGTHGSAKHRWAFLRKEYTFYNKPTSVHTDTYLSHSHRFFLKYLGRKLLLSFQPTYIAACKWDCCLWGGKREVSAAHILITYFTCRSIT